MIDKKLNACRKAYEEEFEYLAKQFEEINEEIEVRRVENRKNRKSIED